jgi:hypothetical protein
LDQPTSAKKPSPIWKQLNEDPKAVWPMNTLYNLHVCLINYESSFSELSQEIQCHA